MPGVLRAERSGHARRVRRARRARRSNCGLRIFVDRVELSWTRLVSTG